MKNTSNKTPPPTDNPYINGKREWMERYGDMIKQKQMWQGISVAAILCATVATLGAISLAGKSEFVPYVVEIDKLGRVNNVCAPSSNFKAEKKHIQGALAGWIQGTRSVFSDGSAQRLGVEKSFASISKSDPSFVFLSRFSKENWKRSTEETVNVELIGQPLPITEKTWQIEWKEYVKNRAGEVVREEVWQGNFEIYFGTPKSQKTMLYNPLGLFIKSISWTRQQSKVI